jgi:hypothetical protein
MHIRLCEKVTSAKAPLNVREVHLVVTAYVDECKPGKIPLIKDQMPEEKISAREQLKLNEKKVEELNKQADDLHKIAYDLEKDSSAVIAKLIDEEKILAGTTWELVPGKKTTHLEFTGNFKSPEISKVFELTWNGYHSSFVMADGIDLYYDDYRVSIQFDDLKLVAPFIKKMEIILDMSSIRDNLQKMRRDLSALEMICHQLQLMA